MLVMYYGLFMFKQGVVLSLLYTIYTLDIGRINKIMKDKELLKEFKNCESLEDNETKIKNQHSIYSKNYV